MKPTENELKLQNEISALDARENEVNLGTHVGNTTRSRIADPDPITQRGEKPE